MHPTEEPSDGLLDLDYLTVLNTIQDNAKITVQDTYSHGDNPKYTRIFSTIDDDGNKSCVPVNSYNQVGDTSISIHSRGDNIEYLSLINTINDNESHIPAKSDSIDNHCGGTSISTDSYSVESTIYICIKVFCLGSSKTKSVLYFP